MEGSAVVSFAADPSLWALYQGTTSVVPLTIENASGFEVDHGLGNKTEGIISSAIAIPPHSTDVLPSLPAPIFVTANSLS